MKVELIKYTEAPDVISLEWDPGFEQSVIDQVLGEEQVLAWRFSNCIHIEKMDDELSTIIEKYFKKKRSKEAQIKINNQ